ncbi:MAG: hypothetical protein PHD48_11405 [Alphaproteobacteria bacterium]|nr:hypothetical protein [Alphaproteobacteria bacterium]
MNWKKEVVATVNDAVFFLETHIPILLPGSVTECGRSPYFSCDVRNEADGNYLFSFDTYCTPKHLDLLNLKLDVPFDQRYAVTDLAIKALLGVASENQYPSIDLHFARGDEARILPAYGAFPTDMASNCIKENMDKIIISTITRFHQNISPADQAVLQDIATTFSTDEDKAWFELAAQRITIPGQGLFSELIFSNICKEGSLRIDFSHAPTMKFLEGRLGALPPLPTSERQAITFKRKRLSPTNA